MRCLMYEGHTAVQIYLRYCIADQVSDFKLSRFVSFLRGVCMEFEQRGDILRALHHDCNLCVPYFF